MSNFSVNTVNGVYSYTNANVYLYLGHKPASGKALERAFHEYGIQPSGTVRDLKRLESAMYEDYSKQVQQQIDNQNNPQVIPWAGLCAQIGIQATGNYETDFAAFNNAIQLLSQSALDGQAMTYFAGLRSEAQRAFGLSNQPVQQNAVSFYNFQTQHLT